MSGSLAFIRRQQRGERALRLPRLHRKCRVEPRPEVLQELVGLVHVGDPRPRQLLR